MATTDQLIQSMGYEMHSHNSAVQRLNQAGIHFELFEHDAVFTMDDVARTLSIPVDSQVKTLVLAYPVEGGTALVLCGISANGQLDMRKVAQTLGVSRSKLQLLNAEHIQSALGVPRGAIGLAHSPGPHPSLLSAKLLTSPFLYFGAGENTLTLKVPTHECAERLPLMSADIEK